MSPAPDIFDDPRLTAYVLGELAEADRAEVERRIAASPQLAAEVETLRQTVGLVSEAFRVDWPQPVGSSLASPLLRQSLATKAGSVPLPRRARQRWPVIGPLAIAVAAVMLLFVSEGPMVPHSNLIASNWSQVPASSLWHDRFDGMGVKSNEIADFDSKFSLSEQLYRDAENPSPLLSNSIHFDVTDRRWSRDVQAGVTIRLLERSSTPQLFNAPTPPAKDAQDLEGDQRKNEAAPPLPLLLKQQADRVADAAGTDRPAPAWETVGEPPRDAPRDLKEWRLHDDSEPAGSATSILEDKTSIRPEELRLYFAFQALVPPAAMEVSPLPAAVARERATNQGRYSDLRRRIPAPQDVVRLGRFHDAGQVKVEAGQSVPEYRVYVAPDWYIWGRRHESP